MILEPALLEVLPVIEPPSLNRPASETLAPVVIENLPKELTRHVRERLNEIPVVGKLQSAVVIHTEEKAITVLQRNGELNRIDWQGLKWARPYKDENTRGPKPKYATDIIQQGDIVRIHKTDNGKFKLSQIPAVKVHWQHLRRTMQRLRHWSVALIFITAIISDKRRFYNSQFASNIKTYGHISRKRCMLCML